MGLKKMDQNMLVDSIMLVFFLISGITGLMLYLRMRRSLLLGLSVSQWHTYASIGLLVIVGIHLLLHFSLVVGYLKNLLKRK